MSGPLQALTIVTALGCGLKVVRPLRSSFVMPVLALSVHVAADESVNACAVTPVFMLALFGPERRHHGLGARRPERALAPLLLAGSALYALGVPLITMAFHAQALALDRVEPAGAGARTPSSRTRGNHVRTITACPNALRPARPAMPAIWRSIGG